MMNTTISADYVWDLAQSLSLDNQKWLANKLHEDIKAGRVYSSEEVHRMMENKYPWLCK